MRNFLLVVLLFVSVFSQAQSWENLGKVDANGLFSIYFQNANTGYAGGFQYVYKTIDGGSSWTVVSGITVSSNFFERINFLNSNFGYIIGRSRSFSTVDGGSTWSDLTTDSKGNDGVFLTTTTGIAVGDYQPFFANIRKTDDGGTTWTDVNNSNASQSNYGISFYNATSGVIVGANKQVLKTTDGGTTWNEIAGVNITGFVIPQFVSVFFVPGTTTGYAIANSTSMSYHGWIYKTTDGGDTWFETDSVLSDLNAVFFRDVLHGYIGGTNGYIFYTNDGGMNWYSQSSHTTGEIRDIFFLDETTGFAVADNGDFLKFNKNSGIESTGNLLSISVFPNPVKDKLTVFYGDKTKKSLMLYDVTGNLIQTVVLSKNRTELSLKNFSTGIYFYRITEDGKLLKTGKIQKQ